MKLIKATYFSLTQRISILHSKNQNYMRVRYVYKIKYLRKNILCAGNFAFHLLRIIKLIHCANSASKFILLISSD